VIIIGRIFTSEVTGGGAIACIFNSGDRERIIFRGWFQSDIILPPSTYSFPYKAQVLVRQTAT